MNQKPIKVKSVTFGELDERFKQKIFAIPHIQRDFVWTKKKILGLLDSIKKHYPIGSFLICKIPSEKSKNLRESTIFPLFDYKNNKECWLVVDGQQRLSVIYAVLNGHNIPTKRYKESIDVRSICLSQRQNKGSEFEFYKIGDGNHITLTDILQENAKSSPKKERRISECIDSFKSYSFPFICIDGFDEKRMREAFIRLNKGGTTLSAVDRIFAESYQKDTDLRAHICNLVEHELKNGFNYIDKIHLVKAIAANLGHEDFVGSTLNTFATKLANPHHEYHKKYKRERGKIEHSIKLSADFLAKGKVTNGMYVDGSYLPYPAMLSLLSVFYYANKSEPPSKRQIKEIRRWFWITGFTQRYSGAKQRDNLLNDAREMKKLANNKNYKLKLEGRRKIEKLSMNQLDKIKYTRGALRNAFFCYLISKKPLELISEDPIPTGDVSSIFNSKNDHHIFSKRLLKNNGFDADKINKILNICFLTFRDNIREKEDPPWTYLAKYKNNKGFKKILSSHVLPKDNCILKKGDVAEKYKRFIKQRKELIKKDLISIIGREFIED